MSSANEAPNSASRGPAVEPSNLARARRRLLGNPAAVIGIVIVVSVIVAAILAPYIAPYPQHAGSFVDFRSRHQPPSLLHLMGTDNVGRDMLSRVLFGYRVSLLLVVGVLGVAVPLGVLLGLLAGYFGGKVETAIMWLTNVMLAVPALVMALAISAVLTPDLVHSMIAITALWWTWHCRLVYRVVKSVVAEDFVEAARVAGASHLHILFREILPNCTAAISVKTTLDAGFVILFGASLSFLGLGVQPPTPDLGTMVSAGAQFLPEMWWEAVMPGLAVLYAILGFNLLGDGLRDMLDVEMTDVPAGPILEIQRLSVGFAGYGGTTQVLHEVDLRVAAGERAAIIGESGSGKTVTMKTVIGTLPHPAGRVLGGSVRFDGQELLNLGRRERERLKGTDISIVHQDPLSSFNPVFTIGDHLDDVLRFADRRLGTASAAADRRRRIEATLRQVQLKEPERVLRSHPFQLSGGMRQRVLIAMALMHRPKLLIADEPGTALDVTTQDEILRLLNQLVAEEQLTLIMVTHNLAVVRQTADYVHVMQAGRIVEHGPVREIFQAPRMPYTRRLLEAIPPLYGPKVQHRQAHGTTPVITATDVVKRFTAPRRWLEPARPPVTAVLNATLTICRGDIFGIAGESGSGKTTVARMIIGLASPTSGRIEIDGKSIEAWRRDPAFRRRIQIVYQNPASSLNPKRTVAETLTVPLAFGGAGNGAAGRRQRAQRIRELLDRVELPANFAERYPHQLSGGQKQRVAIARALAVGPEIVVLDEPTSSLDVSVQKTVIDLLLRLRDELGLTYVFISHDLSLMRNFCNRIAVMFRGEICEQGETGAVFENPRHPYTRALIASVPVLTEAEEQAKPHVTLEDRRAVLASTTQ